LTSLRYCKYCGLKSDDLELFVNHVSSKYGKRNLCLECKYKENNANKKAKEWKTDHQVRKRYGIDAETYKQRMSSSSSCEICGKQDNLCYDHCHQTMRFRGILCRSCNKAIGALGDTLQSVLSAVKYLSKESDNDTH
jgi:hypothetical protein